jgi:transposase InsO family protein
MKGQFALAARRRAVPFERMVQRHVRELLPTLEYELLERRRSASQAEVSMACFSFIEGWYNPVRLHSVLGNRSPMAYEAIMKVVTTEP